MRQHAFIINKKQHVLLPAGGFACRATWAIIIPNKTLLSCQLSALIRPGALTALRQAQLVSYTL